MASPASSTVPSSISAIIGKADVATPNNKINFCKACMVIYDNVPKALRFECYEEAKVDSFLKQTAKPDDLDFSDLVDHLASPDRTVTKQQDSLLRNLIGSYYYYGFKAKRDMTRRQKNSSYLVSIGSESTEFVSHYGNSLINTNACILGQLSIIEKIDCSGTYMYVVHRSLPKPKGKAHEFQVYFQTIKCQAIYKLKQFRNAKLGHPNFIDVTDDELKQLFVDVREAYKQLGTAVTKDIMEELKKIENAIIAEDSVINLLKECYNKIERDQAKINEKLSSLEEHQGYLDKRQDQFEEQQDQFEKHQEELEVQQDEFEERQDGFEERQDQFEERLDQQEALLIKLKQQGGTMVDQSSLDEKNNENVPSEKEIEENIINNMPKFKRYTDITELASFLIKYHLLTQDEYSHIKALPNRDKAMHFYTEVLPKKGSRAYITFYQCLQEAQQEPSCHTGHKDLLKLLDS